MEEQWKLALEKIENERPEFVIPQNSTGGVPLVEVSLEGDTEDDLNMFGISKDDNKGINSSNAYDGDLNPMTFNHVKSSNAFASHKRLGGHLSIIEEEAYHGAAANRGDATDFNQWLAKSQNNKGIKKSEDGWQKKPHVINRAFSQ